MPFQTEISEVLDFWFAGYPVSRLPLTELSKRWFSSQAEFDQEIQTKLGSLHTQASQGALDTWQDTPEGCLALLILLDQCSRNLFRGSPQAFAWDAQALTIAKKMQAEQTDQKLPFLARLFVYLPFEHSENEADQNSAVEALKMFEAQVPESLKSSAAYFLDYAIKHQEVIQLFGRFPHRNERLGRISSPEELEFLSQPGSSFG
jgi:uncharacterized protein (DUF924 family)